MIEHGGLSTPPANPAPKLASRGEMAAGLVAFVWPFVFLFPYVVPVGGRFLLVGNDFGVLYYSSKAYLLDGLSHGVMRWWSPAEAAGFPFYSNPFSQAFYPLNILLTIAYRLFGGWQLLDHQRYTVLGLGLFSLGLFRWLRALGFDRRIALSAAMVMAVSFKLSELLRFPNAIHTAAWYPWVLLCSGRVVESSSTRTRVVNGLLLAGALVCLMTGGYPYYIVYSPFLFGPYVLIRLVPRWSRALLGSVPKQAAPAWTTLVAAGLLALAVVTPYLIKTRELMQQTSD
ncbi:MAG TPA: hypothetical protein VK955_05115, partial [Xanthobacteraceae bacterium]|nr:hypothetical protein [Xanthobacteraceae bacterium]